MYTCALNQKIGPYRLDRVLSWHHGFVDPSVSLRGLGQ